MLVRYCVVHQDQLLDVWHRRTPPPDLQDRLPDVANYKRPNIRQHGDYHVLEIVVPTQPGHPPMPTDWMCAEIRYISSCSALAAALVEWDKWVEEEAFCSYERERLTQREAEEVDEMPAGPVLSLS